MWYFYNYSKDQSDEYELKRDFIEYHASFIEPETVKKIRNNRENSVEIDSDTFAKTIKDMFGRDLNIEEVKEIASENQTETKRNRDEFSSNVLKSEFWKDLE